jgi:hypothetical protein
MEALSPSKQLSSKVTPECQSGQDFSAVELSTPRFSVECLMNFITALQRGMEIVVRRKSRTGTERPSSSNGGIGWPFSPVPTFTRLNPSPRPMGYFLDWGEKKDKCSFQISI